MEAGVDVPRQCMFVPLTATGRFKLKDALKVVRYPYVLTGVSENEGTWGHVESFIGDVEWCESAVIILNKDLPAESDIN